MPFSFFILYSINNQKIGVQAKICNEVRNNQKIGVQAKICNEVKNNQKIGVQAKICNEVRDTAIRMQPR